MRVSIILRYIVTFFVLIAINIFGLHDFHEDQLFIVFNTYDFLLLFINVIFVLLVFLNSDFREILFNSPLRFFFYIFVIVLLVFISMPFRGEISIIDAIRVGRHYLIIPVAFFIYYDVLKQDSAGYYLKFFSFIAIVSTVQIIINAVSPSLVNEIFNDIRRAETDYKGSFKRNVLLSSTMLFPHIATIRKYAQLLLDKFQLNNFLFFIFFFLGSALQGFRIYLIALIIVLLVITLLVGNTIRNISRWIVILIIAIPSLIYLDSNYLDDQIFGKFYTSYYEVIEGTGSFQGRLDFVEVRKIPLLLAKPTIGWGFIYHDSEYGKKLNLPTGTDPYEARMYGLYSVDSGYLTLLMQFGILGVAIILLFLIKIIISLFDRSRKGMLSNKVAIGVILLLVLSLATHGGFYREFGLIPLTIMLGLTAKNNS